MLQPVREVAQGRWRGILAHFGLTDKQLSGKHCACPVCSGTDRFRYDDLEGRGTFYCSHCGPGDGVELVMRMKGLHFKEAAQAIEAIAGVVQPAAVAKQPDEAHKRAALRRVWSESSPLQHGDEAMRYLAGRGLHMATPPDNLRLHPALAYYDGEKVTGRYPAMVALVQAPDGSGATIHRTYLQDGRKAPVEAPKKLMSGKPFIGGAIRLSPAGEEIAIAEGIETALAASSLFGIPVWSTINAAGIETFEPPAGIKRVVICADNDPTYTGQRSAYSAAFRLVRLGFDVEVKLPPRQGDWADELMGARISSTVGESSRIYPKQQGVRDESDWL
jgi:putative DNA primase/helicase